MERLVRQCIVTWLLLAMVVHATDGNVKCLSCDSSTKPRDCQYITTCGPHEVCFTTQYVTAAGTVRYRTGCRDIQQCPSLTKQQVRRTSGDILTCTSCCNDTLCNSKLCTDDDIPSLTSRGPICHSCDQQADPSSCHSIRQCGLDQECILMRYETQMGNDLLFKTDCISKQTCAERIAAYQRAISSSFLVGKRAINSHQDCALKCCDTDLCNSDCSGDRVIHLHNNSVLHIQFPTTPLPAAPISDKPTQPTTKLLTTKLLTTTRQTTTRPTTTRPTTARPTTARPTTAAPVSCVDQHTASYCKGYISLCTSIYPEQKQWAYNYCRRTCNMCNQQPSNSGSSDCADTWSQSDCTYWIHWCTHPSGDNYQTLKNCRKTCNVC